MFLVAMAFWDNMVLGLGGNMVKVCYWDGMVNYGRSGCFSHYYAGVITMLL